MNRKLTIPITIGVISAIFILGHAISSQVASRMRRRPILVQNLRMIEGAKEQWESMNIASNQWPSKYDLNVYLGGTKRTFEDVIRPVGGEVYVINKTGNAPYAYFPNAWHEFQAGQLVTARDFEVSSNKLSKKN